MGLFSRLFGNDESYEKRRRDAERQRALDEWQSLDRRVDREAFRHSSPEEIRRNIDLTRKMHDLD